MVLPMVEPFLYKNGGPILAVQVENEYGGFGLDVCDKRYLDFLLELNQKHLVSSKAVLLSCDFSGHL